MFAAAPGESSGWTVQDTQGFLELQLRHGRTGVATTVTDARFVDPPQHVAKALRLQNGERVFALERVRSLEGEVAMFSTNWFPSEVGTTISEARDVLDGSGSLNSTLRDAGFVISGAHRIVDAMRAPANVAAHLHIDEDQPVLRVRSLSWDSNELRFDYYETWVLTDVVPLEVNVVTG
ncbi:GntR family transcriptional regulator [Agromyces sp. NPDC058484]|uniref:GntR family transcriptional regulator n=1 Tax=Agromyces sp. NPDC058484 TaxID=3346524 RepID=UPI0036610DE3